MPKMVVVVRGGNTARQGSMKTGEFFKNALTEYRVRDVSMQRDGTCLVQGRAMSLLDASRGADLVVNALHGSDGEGGMLQSVCAQCGVPFTGVSGVGGRFSLHKALAREIVRDHHIPVVPYLLIERSETLARDTAEAIRLFGQPLAIKPPRGAGGEGVAILESAPDIIKETEEQFAREGSVLLEPFLRGSVVHVFVAEEFRGDKRYVLPLVEVARVGEEWRTRCPADISNEEMYMLGEYAKKIFDLFMLRHYAQFKFSLTPKIIRFMEVNALPRIGGGALFSTSLSRAGISGEQFARHVVSLAEG